MSTGSCVSVLSAVMGRQPFSATSDPNPPRSINVSVTCEGHDHNTGKPRASYKVMVIPMD